MVRYGCQHCEDVEFSAEDASRTDRDFLVEVIRAAAEAGANVINLPDTVGYTTPDEYGQIFRAARVALASYPERRLERALPQRSGPGGREFSGRDIRRRPPGRMHHQRHRRTRRKRVARRNCGRLARAPGSLLVPPPTFRSRKFIPTSRMLSSVTGVSVPPNKAVVGANAFAHEAGIHQDGILKNPLTYEIIVPEKVGVPCAPPGAGKTFRPQRVALAPRRARLLDHRRRTRGLLWPGHGAS